MKNPCSEGSALRRQPRDRRDISELLRRAVAAYEALSPEERAAHDRAQRESWVRGMMARCEHGVLDFEQCPDCRGWR